MGFTITELVLLSIFVLCIIIGVIGMKILAHRRNKLSDINDFDNETAPITIEAINNQREMDEDWKEEIEQELKAWRDSIRERKNKGI